MVYLLPQYTYCSHYESNRAATIVQREEFWQTEIFNFTKCATHTGKWSGKRHGKHCNNNRYSCSHCNISQALSSLNVLSSRVITRLVEVDKQRGCCQSRRCIVQLEVVGPLHCAPVVRLCESRIIIFYYISAFLPEIPTPVWSA